MKLGDLPPLYWSGDSHALVRIPIDSDSVDRALIDPIRLGDGISEDQLQGHSTSHCPEACHWIEVLAFAVPPRSLLILLPFPHLSSSRDESTFYPKFNFYNVVRTIPEGANVVFQFGEIDCREGIVFAVQKMIYEV